MTLSRTGPITVSKELFGGKIDFLVYGASQHPVEEVMKDVYREALRLQRIFNIYDPWSELSRLNQARKARVSGELLDVLQKALLFSRKTRGSYDVTLGRIILLRKKGESAEQGCSYEDIRIEGDEVTLTHPDVLVDLGSIAKGYMVDRLAEALQQRGITAFLIDARGDICVKGGQVHVLGIQHPREEQSICSIRLKDQAVATSGDYHQYVGEFGLSHIVNQKDATSVTVVAPTAEEADVYATALFTTSDEERKSLLDGRPDVRALVVRKDSTLSMLNGFEEIIEEGKI
ncbi:MAG: FAD:protein FMN transferase [DPANN group archaeon]|nr:FAD:protein FMN transferase [DPANN group archaeon]